MAVGARHTVEIRIASEVREGDEILGRHYKPVRIGKTEHYPGTVVLYRREGPPRHVLQQIGQFAHGEPLVVLVGSAEGPTAAEVEGGARVLSQEAKATGDQGDWNPWDRLDDSEKEELRREVRAVLKGAREAPGPMPEQGPGPMPEQGPAPMPEQGPAPMPEQGPAPMREQGPGPMPEQGPAPMEEQGPGPMPEQGPAPMREQGPGPVPEQGPGPMREQGPGPMPENGPAQG